MKNKLRDEVKKVIHGKNQVIDKVLMAILSGGHVLLEDIPGVGKTTLAMAFAKTMNLSYKRISFNPDVLPSDITGFSVYNKEKGELEYKPGAVMCNILLADEINRGFSKTQAALLEAMEEQSVTVDGVTYELPDPFVVIATSNPVGTTGTGLLPESQLDRFMICLKIGYPDRESQLQILKDRENNNPLDSVKLLTDEKEIRRMIDEVNTVFISDKLLDYIIRLCEATRNQGNIELGVSPRGVLALTKMAKACAYINDRDYCIPEDIQTCFSDVCKHRIILNAKSRMNKVSSESVLKHILKEVEVPKVGEKDA